MLAAALTIPALPGVGVHDPRVGEDPSVVPWSVVTRVQVPGVSRCTGFAVAPTRIVTAAHCLYAAGLERMVPARAVHVLSGYDSGSFARHEVALPDSVVPGFVPGGNLGFDAAVLVLGTTLTPSVLPLADADDGAAAMLGGYSQDRAEALAADPACRVLAPVRDSARQELRPHTCAGTRGTSGAPLLIHRTAIGQVGWVAAGVQVAGHADAPGGLAVPARTSHILLPRRKHP